MHMPATCTALVVPCYLGSSSEPSDLYPLPFLLWHIPTRPHSSLPPGLYLDSDIECWRESYDMLAGFDFVAQVSTLWLWALVQWVVPLAVAALDCLWCTRCRSSRSASVAG